MLYRSHHHPFLFPPNPFTSTSLSSSPHPHPFSLSPLLLLSSSSSCSASTSASASASASPLESQVVVSWEMERVEGPLRSSFRPDMSPKTSYYYHHQHQHQQQQQQQQQQGLFDESCGVNGQNSGDYLFVDDLLDFSNAVVEDPEEHKQEEALENDDPTVSKAASSIVTSVKDDDFGSLSASELILPADDLESLEWLSHFVDDSFSGYSLTCPTTEPVKVKTKGKAKTEPEAAVESQPCFMTPVLTKARSKRTRAAGVPGWSLGSSSLTESSSSSTSSSSSSTTTSFSPCNPWVFYSSLSQSQTAESLLYGKPPVKKHKKKTATEQSGGGTWVVSGGVGGGGQQPRRCSHCGVQKTPQWRAGPLGAKTLCNACGVRYKSGRLLPEYRPACSPTFSTELHSNNHRKVLEMRRKKETESGLPPPVQSF